MACLVEFVCLPALRVVRSSFGNLPWRSGNGPEALFFCMEVYRKKTVM